MMMKIKATMLSITGLILSGCFFANDEIKLDDIGNFKITVNEAKDNRQAHLTGLLHNSAMGISDIKTTSHNDELNITLFQKLAGSEYSGKLDKEIALEHNIKKITYENLCLGSGCRGKDFFTKVSHCFPCLKAAIMNLKETPL